MKAFLIIILAAFAPLYLNAQTTEFSYQGSLRDGANQATGNYDFEFRVFDLAVGGMQIGPLLTRTNVAVANGSFSVQLDFGGVFPGADRFLEIRVRPASVGSYTSLVPRHRITSAPYAVKSIVAETANNANNLGGVAAGQYVVNSDVRLSNPRDPLPGSTSYIQNSTTTQTSSNFNISGNGTVGGTMRADQYNIGTNRVLGVSSLGGTYVGTNAGANTTAGFNSFVGAASGVANTTGTSNSFFGYASGDSNVSGHRNSFFGRSAGAANTASDNAFFGYSSGAANTTGFNNSFFGMESGLANTTGDANSFFGTAAGKDNTIGVDNVFVGVAAGFTNLDGNQNTFIGRSAGRLNVGGDSNTFVGYAAGRVTTSSANTFVGAFSGENTISNGNVFVGASSGKANTTAIENAFFGTGSGSLTTTGGGNTFIGHRAGESNTTGVGNTFVGLGAGFLFSSGDFNTALGNSADVDDGLHHATAIGSGSRVSESNTVQLGRENGTDKVRIAGLLLVGTLGSAGSTSICRNASNQLATCSSSLKYKINLTPFSPGLDLIKRLRPLSFDWKSGGRRDLGLGAEDVAAIEPLLVTYNTKGEVEGVKYDRVGVVLINAVKEQQTLIETQRVELNAQRNQVEDLRSRVEALTKLVCSLKPDGEGCKTP